MFKKIIFFLGFLTFAYSCSALATVSSDFHFEYENRAGQLAMGTVEKIIVTPGLITVNRSAKQIGKGSDINKVTLTYHPNAAQMEKLIKIIQNSGFMNWPKSADISHHSQADEFIQITMDGKTVKHTKWEKDNREAFRILWTHFNDWYTEVRSVQF